MIHVTLSLPDDVGAALGARVRDGGYADLADYVRALIETDVGDEAETISPEIAAMLEEGERSGYEPYDFVAIVAEARARSL